MRKLVGAIIAMALVVGACANEAAETPEKLTLLAHDSFADAVTDETFQPFTDETGIEVEVLAGGDAGGMVTQAVLAAGNPVADVIFGVDDTFLSRAIDGNVFATYTSGLIDAVPSGLKLGPEDTVTPINYGDVCLNYDKEWFESTQLRVPTDLEDLLVNIYAGAMVVEHPATSSPGLAFMLATIAEFGEEGWVEYWERLRANGVHVVDSWTEAYYEQFTWAGGGARPLVVSYGSSPPAEVIFADPPVSEPPTAAIEATCFRQVEFAGVLAGTDAPDAARALVDFLLSPPFQAELALTLFVYPARGDVDLPAEFTATAIVAEDPYELEPGDIAARREGWIETWTDAVLR
jgi:thiamine transport system substrate-binding protein